MLDISSLTKTYRNGAGTVHALGGIDLKIEQGDFVVVHGASGSGKTTLLHTLGGMLRPTSGTVSFRDEDVYAWSARRRNHYRKRRVGFVFQKLFLMHYLTAYDNIRLALAAGRYSGNHRERIHDLVTRFGLAERLHHRPSQLSVGEQQRIAAARAIAAEPDLILADEPTGNLDRGNTDAFAEFLTEENERGLTIVLVTHSEHLLDLGNRSIELTSGQIAP
jgi:ABC-type lipoprotein export system ATPase subunit